MSRLETTILLFLNLDSHEWTFDNFTPENTLSSVTYNVSDLNTNFNTLGGNYHTHLSQNQTSQLENSIQSITFDLTDWNFNDSSNGTVNPEFYAALTTNQSRSFSLQWHPKHHRYRLFRF